MSDRVRPEDTVVVTTADFRRGQAAARVDFAKDPDAEPNRPLLDRVGAEFSLGYRYEWHEYCEPLRLITSGND